MLEARSLEPKSNNGKTLMDSARPRGKVRVGNPNAGLLHTEQEIQEVSERLARIQQVGICCEANGDYVRSGDLAYRIPEIIRATADLSKKSQRAKG